MQKPSYVCSVLLMTLAIPLFAEDCVRITGTVRNLDDTTLQGVALFLKESSDVVESLTYTDENGQFEFQNLEQGSYELGVQRAGFQAITAPIRLEGESLRRIEINLRPVPYKDVKEKPPNPPGVMIYEDDWPTYHL